MCAKDQFSALRPLESTRAYFLNALDWALAEGTLARVHLAGLGPLPGVGPLPARAGAGGHLGAHSMPRLDLIFSGQQEVAVAGIGEPSRLETVLVTGGQGLFYPAFAPYRVNWAAPCLGLGVVWHERYIRLVAFDHGGGRRLIRRSPYHHHAAEPLAGRGHHLLAAMETAPDPPMDLAERLALARLLLSATRDHVASDKGRPRPASKGARTWYDAERFIDMHLHEPFSRDDVAATVGVTGPYLSRLCHRQTGRTYQQHVTHLRIEQARHLLAQSPMSAKQVAAATGFANARHFGDAFRRVVGIPPGRFSRAARRSSTDGASVSDADRTRDSSL